MGAWLERHKLPSIMQWQEMGSKALPWPGALPPEDHPLAWQPTSFLRALYFQVDELFVQEHMYGLDELVECVATHYPRELQSILSSGPELPNIGN